MFMCQLVPGTQGVLQRVMHARMHACPSMPSLVDFSPAAACSPCACGEVLGEVLCLALPLSPPLSHLKMAAAAAGRASQAWRLLCSSGGSQSCTGQCSLRAAAAAEGEGGRSRKSCLSKGLLPPPFPWDALDVPPLHSTLLSAPPEC